MHSPTRTKKEQSVWTELCCLVFLTELLRQPSPHYPPPRTHAYTYTPLGYRGLKVRQSTYVEGLPTALDSNRTATHLHSKSCVCVCACIMYNFLITLKTNKPLYDSAVQLCAWRNSSIQPHQSTCMHHNLTARSLVNRDEYKQFPLRRKVCGSRGGVVMVVCHQASSLPVCVVDNDMVTGDSLMATFLAGCRHFPLLTA